MEAALDNLDAPEVAEAGLVKVELDSAEQAPADAAKPEDDAPAKAPRTSIAKPSGPEFSTGQIAAGKSLVKEETREQGAVSFATYDSYVRAAGGYAVALVVMVFYILSVAAKLFSDWWLSFWIRQGDGEVRSL